ncbi:PREDICTED: histidine kinase 2 isoform X2 [Tarenaya hassleriana]|uniref:histidine kinase 2 isoform X2 n=1 Tax=Tarenaya hassleriana TaxID=28532 RepID=UPI00053C13DD|nr:PREDICTED: histidine kinase 2 isoform X2 [Tarenaya hassleriana]
MPITCKLSKRPEEPNRAGKWRVRHNNVSRSEIYALASLFYDSDQVTSFECHKESGLAGLVNGGVTCSITMRSSEKRHCTSVAEMVKSEAQCFVQEGRTPWNLCSVSSPAPMYENPEGNLLQSTQLVDYETENHQNFSSYLMNGWWCLLAGVLAFWKNFSRRSERTREKKEKASLQQPLAQTPSRGTGDWRKKLLTFLAFLGILLSVFLFWHLNKNITRKRTETLASMCDERARMLQDQFNVSMNHVHALAILVSTFHHGKTPSAIDQKTFGEYTERTNFERPLTSGVAYALKVLHSEREQFEKEHGWTIKKMETEDQTLVQDCVPENLDPAPLQDEYAPVIFAQETVSHIVSIDMMSGKEDRENILRARATGKGVLTSPFKLLKSNHLGVVLTFAVYNTDLPHDATEEQRIQATMGYLGASYDIPSLVEKLLHQLASKQTIAVNVYDTTNASAPIRMYGSEIGDESHHHISTLDFGDPSRKHEMHCRFKQKPPTPWSAIGTSGGLLVISFLLGYIFYEAINQIAKVEEDCQKMMELKARAEAADVAKSQFLATVSHEIRTPMNGVLGMLTRLMDTDLDAIQLDYAQTAHDSGKDLISLINEVLDQAKIESGKLDLENVPFDPRFVLDNVLSLLSGKANEKGIELAVYVSGQVPDVVTGDPGRFRQIITNLVGNSIKFTHDKGHIFVSVHLADEVREPLDTEDGVLKQRLGLALEKSGEICNTFSGYPVVDASGSWRNFRTFNGIPENHHGPDKIELLVTVEDTGIGIPLDAQDRIFTPFMQADSSTSRTYGGTGIGLSISKRLVELMQGEIGFVSEPGTGSTFSFTGIFGKAEKNASVTKWEQYDSAVQQFRGLRALVIDSRSIRAEVTRYHLQRLGISANFATCLRMASTFSSKLANLAMVLIDKDVWNKKEFTEFSELLNNSGQETSMSRPKIFLLATSATPMERVEFKSSGLVDDVVIKPLRLSVLIGFLQQALSNGKYKHTNRKKRENLGHLLRDKRILVVDDNLVNRRVAEGALKKYGATVKCVDSGKAALAMLKPPHSFNACFMDLQMPEMDGFEATRKIRDLEKETNEKIESGEESADVFGNVDNWHVPILAMTADVIQATNEKCVKCGMDGYVSKPFEEEVLYKAVVRFFECSS